MRWAPLVNPASYVGENSLLTLDLLSGPSFHPEGSLVLRDPASGPLAVSAQFALEVCDVLALMIAP